MFHDPATTYAEALENLTEENWHRERALIEARVERLRSGIARACEESDYCYACDCHPSHGHADDCPMREEAP